MFYVPKSPLHPDLVTPRPVALLNRNNENSYEDVKKQLPPVEEVTKLEVDRHSSLGLNGVRPRPSKLDFYGVGRKDYRPPVYVDEKMLLEAAKVKNTKVEAATASIGKVIHLQLTNKGLSSLAPRPQQQQQQRQQQQQQQQFVFNILSWLRNLKVLYIDQNRLQNLDGVNCIPKLTMLFAQQNDLVRTDHITDLPRLENVYLQRNNINLVDGFSGCGKIKELYLNNQNITTRVGLRFTADAINNLSQTLQRLDCAHNLVSDILFQNDRERVNPPGEDDEEEGKYLPVRYGSFSELRQLVHLDLSDNNVSDLEQVIEMCYNMPMLQYLNLGGNPVTKEKKYRSSVILACPCLSVLDGKKILENERSFYIGLKQAQEKSRVRGGGAGGKTVNSAAAGATRVSGAGGGVMGGAGGGGGETGGSGSYSEATQEEMMERALERATLGNARLKNRYGGSMRPSQLNNPSPAGMRSDGHVIDAQLAIHNQNTVNKHSLQMQFATVEEKQAHLKRMQKDIEAQMQQQMRMLQQQQQQHHQQQHQHQPQQQRQQAIPVQNMGFKGQGAALSQGPDKKQQGVAFQAPVWTNVL